MSAEALFPDAGLPTDRDASGRELGDKEVGLVEEAIRSGTLSATWGVFVDRFEWAFAHRMDATCAVACSSGSAAVHAALAALELEAGDEVITSPITDMGAITPIAYEGAAPVFCDVDPDTGNVTAETLEAAAGPRTRAVIVTHLFGMPCEMAPIVDLARARGWRLIEDCAQAPLAEDRGEIVGSFGDLACFSFQQGKHITTGEGGMVITSDEELGRRLRCFVNKGYVCAADVADHVRPALNYRMTELQGAVGFAQMEKLDDVVEARRRTAAAFRAELAGLEGVRPTPERPGAVHVFWRFPMLVDPEIVSGGCSALAYELEQRGVPGKPRYIGRPAFECGLFREWRRFPVLRAAYEAAGREPPREGMAFPGARAFLDRVFVLPWNEHYHRRHLEGIGAALREALEALTPA